MLYLILQVIIVLAFIAAFLVALLFTLVSIFLTGIYYSIQPEAPVTEEDNDKFNKNPLFRHIPPLKSKLAWEELGDNFPTPIHTARIQLPTGKQVKFWLKREDLSSSIYGGNKVRTLQYQLPACKIHAQKHPEAKFYVLGSGGSNQIIASLVHGKRIGGLEFNVCCMMPDEPDFDNTLNLLSTLSFKPAAIFLWDTARSQLLKVALVLRNGVDKVFGVGGNSIPGVLGQIGGVLELAEQIEAGLLPDLDAIYLPMGSSCTTTGLIIGVCLARYLNMNAFKSDRFKIVSTLVDHKAATMHRKLNFLKRAVSKYICICPLYGVLHVTAYLKKVSGIDLEQQALEFYRNNWEPVADHDFVGLYGGHSTKSVIAAAFDEHMNVTGPVPWLCGHFAAKSFAVMLERLEYEQDGPNVLLWQTKSAVQPIGTDEEDADEWSWLLELANKSKVVEKWANEGKAYSKLRQGKVDTKNGTKSDYRHVMTPVL